MKDESVMERLVIIADVTRRAVTQLLTTRDQTCLACAGFVQIIMLSPTCGGLAQLVERLVRKDLLRFCDSAGLLWTQ